MTAVRLFRVTLAQLLLLTTIIAAGCAALAQAAHPWTLSIVQAAMLTALFAAIVRLFHRDPRRRTFNAAFLLTAALHMLFLIGWFLSGPNRDPPLGVLLAYSWCLVEGLPYEGNLLSTNWESPASKFVMVGMWVTTFWAGLAIGWLACAVRGDEPKP